MIFHPKFKGEFKFLNQILKTNPDSDLLLDIGDDAAVIKLSNNLSVTIDNYIENQHFSLKYSTPEQIGKKVIEASASDVCAIGGIPQYILIAINCPKSKLELINKIYDGIYAASNRLGAIIIGGDLTTGGELSICVTVLGKVEKIVARSGAKIGDLVVVTGNLGLAAAGLAVFQNNLPGFERLKTKHCEPTCRIDWATKIAPFASSMIDISDGLSSELWHLATSSKVGIKIYQSKLTVFDEISKLAKKLDLDPFNLILNGGDDYELLYTIPKKFEDKILGYIIGEVTQDEVVTMVDLENNNQELQIGGWNSIGRSATF